MSTIEIKKKGNKQIALRVEPELEVAILKAVSADGDASVLLGSKSDQKELNNKKIL